MAYRGWAIMSARAVKSSMNLNDIRELLHAEGGDFTVFYAERLTSWDKWTPMLISACGTGYEVTTGGRQPYYIDTGNGLKAAPFREDLRIRNMITVIDGKTTQLNDDLPTRRIGTWVFK